MTEPNSVSFCRQHHSGDARVKQSIRAPGCWNLETIFFSKFETFSFRSHAHGTIYILNYCILSLDARIIIILHPFLFICHQLV
jgi:hypothetical protein